MPTPSAEEFHQLTANGETIVVSDDLLADIETPLSAYWKLAHNEPYSFLLESVSGGEQVARYSLIGVRPKAVLKAKASDITLIIDGKKTNPSLPESGDALDLLRKILPQAKPNDDPNHPTFVGGAVGMIGYDFVRQIEDLPDSNQDDLQVDDISMMITESVVVFDHAKNLIRISVLAKAGENAYSNAVAEIERIKSKLQSELPPLPNGKFNSHPVEESMTKEEFMAGVEKIKKHIVDGDAFQVVPSIRFSTQVDAHPVTVYRALRSLNPSPFMYFLRFENLDVVGASPELLTGLKSRQAAVRPIAGTRPRGATPQEDFWLGEELLADEKEKAEHIMLIDLGRNDLGRVCKFGSIRVDDMMTIERYSHVMHIVSNVTGTLNDDLDGFDLTRATFPAGTLSGAPKIRAMEIIDDVEKSRRGLYGGAIGFFSANGDVDLAIAIRTILIKDKTAYMQAGAGIVFDSVPETEHQECLNKAKAALKAIEIAQKGL